ncbi:Swc5p [Lachancea thermotolerans CBS 6340]|uniref:SWR1-complex protein 5 n=1 Tax=Lachancea thermotolerans (strain ATCC 56472 / CBS 6340 / NRRL Y-8284) TaxID=559295 RepID=C5E2M1_LACTC|nr:KLTH0H06072p [Lachancea thermotolerans CBS 6340]CAR30282.1 KLTH0H06072p [Lachancea thermotolerans CBS 6340]
MPNYLSQKLLRSTAMSKDNEEVQDTKGVLFNDEEDYNEEEDLDFDPSKEEGAQPNESDNDADGDTGDDDKNYEETNPDYSNIESGQGGLVRTRRARELEDELARRQKYEHIKQEGISQEAKSVWDELQQESTKRLHKSTSIMSQTKDSLGEGLTEELILIDRKYEFAGEVMHEKKWVPKSSAEAQEFLQSTKFTKNPDPSTKTKSAVNDQGLKLRRPLKRPAILEQIIAGALKPKLTTLEKSKLDWATYVDKENLNEELILHNKDGYLAKQDFLNRVETFKDDKYREMRKIQLQQRISDT